MHSARRSLLMLALAGALASPTAAFAVDTPSAPNEDQVHAFFRAVELDDAATVKKLIGSVVHPNQRNPYGGEPALLLAVREDAMRVFKVLLDDPATDPNLTASNGNTALMLAAMLAKRPAVDALLARGAVVNQPGWTALHYAAMSGDKALVEHLIAHGAVVDAVSPPASGAYTPLMLAAREGQDRTAVVLIEHGANPALTNSEGLTAVALAERTGKPRVAAAIARAIQ